MTQSRKNKKIFWVGPSQIDGSPICAIATGIKKPSENPKTGPVVQTYILAWGIDPVQDRQPTTKGGNAAKSICGSCPLQEKICYVSSRYLNGIYDGSTDIPIEPLTIADTYNKVIRLGAYGDPAAVPFFVWKKVLKRARAVVGYTHQWHEPFCDRRLKRYCLASVQTKEEAEQARQEGWKTYRVALPEEGLDSQEIWCPNIINGIQCHQCLLCDPGAKDSKSGIAIPVHGIAPKRKAYKEHRQQNG